MKGLLGFGKKKEEEKVPVVDYTRRYDRQKAISEIGSAGQEKLKKARVLVVGCGDRGIAAAMYLAAAGVGTIGLADNKDIGITDIQRQPIFFTSDIGRKKAIILGNRLKEINPEVEVVPSPNKLRYDNTANHVTKYDIILDCTDNCPSHYLLNDTCVLNSKPLVFATVIKFDGQASVFYAAKGPCYRCLYRNPPNPDTVYEAEQVGVLGPAAGLAGLMQATETMKLITGFGSPLIGRILFFSASDMYFHEAAVKKDENCAVCGKNPAVKQLIDYDEFCGVKQAPLSASAVLDSAKTQIQPSSSVSIALMRQGETSNEQTIEISPADAKKRMDAGEKMVIIDVREPYERDIARIEGSVFVPLGELPSRMNEFGKDETIVVHCHHGVRSAFATEMMRSAGFHSVYSMAGGIDEWSAQVDKKVPRYM